MTFDDYQRESLRTSRAEPARERLLVQGLGLAGEAGEVAQSLKKWAWHGKPEATMRAELQDELGDVLWYVADLASALGLDLGAVAALNVSKLRARYPDGFTADGGKR